MNGTQPLSWRDPQSDLGFSLDDDSAPNYSSLWLDPQER